MCITIARYAAHFLEHPVQSRNDARYNARRQKRIQQIKFGLLIKYLSQLDIAVCFYHTAARNVQKASADGKMPPRCQ